MGSGTAPEKVATSLLSQTTSFTLHILKNLVMAKVDLYGKHIFVSFPHECFDLFWDIEAPYGMPEGAFFFWLLDVLPEVVAKVRDKASL